MEAEEVEEAEGAEGEQETYEADETKEEGFDYYKEEVGTKESKEEEVVTSKTVLILQIVTNILRLHAQSEYLRIVILKWLDQKLDLEVMTNQRLQFTIPDLVQRCENTLKAIKLLGLVADGEP